jgi:undecaprenyl-diphosphatase
LKPRWTALAALVVFALLAAQLLFEGPVTLVDRDIMLAMASHRVDWVTALTLGLSLLNDTLSLLVASALVAAALAWRGHADWAWQLGAVPTGMLLNVALKHLFQRARPALDAPLVHLATYSFPSGHGVASTVFYGTLALLALAQAHRRSTRAAAVAGALAMIALVCFSRVYLGAHYFSDVLAAVCVGVVWLVAWHTLVQRFRP